MYSIQILNGEFHCSVVIQDGTERWIEKDLVTAKQNVITAARVMNGTYITGKEIKIFEVPQQLSPLTSEEKYLLQEIQRGAKVVLDHSDPRIKMKISPSECDMIVKIREGRAKYISLDNDF